MKSFARVVWSEGMHLSQHHFQAQSAYFEDITGATLASSMLPGDFLTRSWMMRRS
jgi:predicted component of type VI protein secretion system